MRDLKYIVRILIKDRFYSILNVLGLSIGLSVATMIMLYVQDDLSFDKHHENWDQIYRVESQFRLRGKEDQYALTPIVLAEMLKETYPEILHITRFQTAGRQIFRKDKQQLYVDNMFFADSTAFRLFTHEFIYGDPNSALTKPRSIVLTESISNKLFGSDNPVNQVIESDNGNYLITGVVRDLPENLHLKFDALISMSTRPFGRRQFNAEERRQRLWNVSVFSYVMLPKNYDLNQIYEKFPAFFEEHMSPMIQQANLGDSYFSPKFIPLDQIHFNSKVLFDLPSGNKSYASSFLVIGTLILLLACVNYINLATARATTRSKEVGVRKVLGSTSFQLRNQFLTESMVVTLVALLFSLGFTAIIINGIGIESLIDKSLSLNFTNNPLLLFGPLVLSLVIGIISGFYPSLYLSTLSSLNALQGSVKSGPRSLLLRKGLVGFQFLISIGIVMATIIMVNQVKYMRNKDLGFNKDNVILIPLQDTTVRNRMEYIKSELLESPSILGITDAFGVGGNVRVGNSLLGAGRRVLNVGLPEDSSFTQDSYNVLTVGKDYAQTLGLKIIAGRDFDENIPTDLTQKVIINKALVDQMGWKDPINKVVTLTAANPPTRVIGVVQDFHAYSMHVEVEPMVIYRYRIRNPRAAALPTLMVNIEGNGIDKTLDFIRTRFEEFDKNHPFEYEFLDQKVEQLYKADARQNQLIMVLTAICILTSCLGLFGLASFTTSRRIKEIGIRKVLGASIRQLVHLIFKDVLILVIIGFIVSVPIVYYILQNWLQEFAYQISLGQSIIMAALYSGTLAILIAFSTVSYHSIKAARRNPVKALRYE